MYTFSSQLISFAIIEIAEVTSKSIAVFSEEGRVRGQAILLLLSAWSSVSRLLVCQLRPDKSRQDQ
jgi:hypothetical protein